MQPLNTTATIGECGVIPAVAVEGLDYCPYIDPNPVDSINGEGHNYFRSSNPYKLESWAAFGEAYYNINPDLKLTRSEEHTSELQSLMRISYAVFCLNKKTTKQQ